jgi:hypothetical protein
MDEYEVELVESQDGMWSGNVVHVTDEGRSTIGGTMPHSTKSDAVEEAKRIARLSKGEPEIVKLDL